MAWLILLTGLAGLPVVKYQYHLSIILRETFKKYFLNRYNNILTLKVIKWPIQPLFWMSFHWHMDYFILRMILIYDIDRLQCHCLNNYNISDYITTTNIITLYLTAHLASIEGLDSTLQQKGNTRQDDNLQININF